MSSRKGSMKMPREQETLIDSIARRKAAAWAWYEHGGGGTGQGVESESTATRRAAAYRPSRFKQEAEARRILPRRHSFDSCTRKSPSFDARSALGFTSFSHRWDCGSALFDSFELVSMSKQLDDSLTASLRKYTLQSAGTGVIATSSRVPVSERVHAQDHHQKDSRFRLPKPRALCRCTHELDVIIARSSSRRSSIDDGNSREKVPGPGKRNCEQGPRIDSKNAYNLAFHQSKLSPYLHLGTDQRKLEDHRHGHQHEYIHHHHHHHHHYLLPEEDLFTSQDVEKSLIEAATAFRFQKISPFHPHPPRRKKHC